MQNRRGALALVIVIRVQIRIRVFIENVNFIYLLRRLSTGKLLGKLYHSQTCLGNKVFSLSPSDYHLSPECFP